MFWGWPEGVAFGELGSTREDGRAVTWGDVRYGGDSNWFALLVLLGLRV